MNIPVMIVLKDSLIDYLNYYVTLPDITATLVVWNHTKQVPYEANVLFPVITVPSHLNVIDGSDVIVIETGESL